MDWIEHGSHRLGSGLPVFRPHESRTGRARVHPPGRPACFWVTSYLELLLPLVIVGEHGAALRLRHRGFTRRGALALCFRDGRKMMMMDVHACVRARCGDGGGGQYGPRPGVWPPASSSRSCPRGRPPSVVSSHVSCHLCVHMLAWPRDRKDLGRACAHALLLSRSGTHTAPHLAPVERLAGHPQLRRLWVQPRLRGDLLIERSTIMADRSSTRVGSD